MNRNQSDYANEKINFVKITQQVRCCYADYIEYCNNTDTYSNDYG